MDSYAEKRSQYEIGMSLWEEAAKSTFLKLHAKAMAIPPNQFYSVSRIEFSDFKPFLKRLFALRKVSSDAR